MSADNPKNTDKGTAEKKKGGLIRADMVGSLDRDEDSVVDWADDEPEPSAAVPEDTTETGTEETKAPPAESVSESPPPEPEPETPPEFPAEAPDEAVAEEAEPQVPAKQPPLKADAVPQPKKDIATPTDPADPPKPAEVKPPEPPPAHRPSAREADPDKGFEKHMRPVPPRSAPQTRKPLTGRILLWGAVLIIVVFTVGYFVSYEPATPAPRTAETGQLFHKIPPVPSSVARGPVPKQPVPALPPRVPAKATAAPASPVPRPTPEPAKKPIAPKAPAPRQAAVSKPKATAPVKAYVPRKYPYAIHMASFQSAETAREKLSDYRRGFQAYLVRTDLGKKGVWYRLFLGHFPSATASLDAIKKYRLKGALVARNRFACLVGAYTTTAAADRTAQQLSDKGFLPYTVTIANVYYLFVGAHPTADAARALLMDLAANGFSSDLIER